MAIRHTDATLVSSSVMHRFLVALVCLILAGALWGSGSTQVQSEAAGTATCAGQKAGFSLSLAITRGGEASPVSAAQSFGGAAGAAFDVPKDGWASLARSATTRRSSPVMWFCTRFKATTERGSSTAGRAAPEAMAPSRAACSCMGATSPRMAEQSVVPALK
jgi:hypothetical protein